MKHLQYVRLSDGVQYSTDFAFFCRYQVIVWNTFDGIHITSGIESRTFYTTSARDYTQDLLMTITEKIHADICGLKYGGEIVD